MNARLAVLDVWRGFSRPFTLLAGLRSHPESWRRFRRTIASQLALTAAIAGVVLAFKDGPTREDEPDEQPKDRAALARAFMTEFSDGGVELHQLVRSLDDREERDETARLTQVLEEFDDLELKPLARTLGVEGRGHRALSRRLRDVLEATRDGGVPASDDEESAEALDFLAVLRSADAQDGGVELSPLVPFLSRLETRATDAEVTDALDEFARAEKRKPSAHPRAWLAWLFSALVFGQWVTLAFTREYQEPLARALCEVAAIEPEDDERSPRVRVDFKWLRKKLMQRLRGLLVLLPGFLVFVPVFILSLPFGLDDYVMPPLMFSWSAYWWCAFTVGRSARAWRDEAAAVPPLPVRWWLARTEDTFGMRWFLPRWVGRFAVWATKRDAAPAVALERAPWVFIGLGLARLITSPPLLRLVFRAPIDMAAADALEHAPPRA